MPPPGSAAPSPTGAYLILSVADQRCAIPLAAAVTVLPADAVHAGEVQVGDHQLPVIDLAGLSALRREAETERLVRAEVAAPFDLERGVVRSNLVRLGALDHLCVLTVHHLAIDLA